MTRYMLDTNTVSYALRGQGRVAERLRAHTPSLICVSSITVAELRYGAEKRGSVKLHALIDTFTQGVTVEPFDDREASSFGLMAAKLAAAGTPIGPYDTLIAAHALSLNVTLVTSNTRHFALVPGLSIEDWY